MSECTGDCKNCDSNELYDQRQKQVKLDALYLQIYKTVADETSMFSNIFAERIAKAVCIDIQKACG